MIEELAGLSGSERWKLLLNAAIRAAVSNGSSRPGCQAGPLQRQLKKDSATERARIQTTKERLPDTAVSCWPPLQLAQWRFAGLCDLLRFPLRDLLTVFPELYFFPGPTRQDKFLTGAVVRVDQLNA
jgi:hypothetical protein